MKKLLLILLCVPLMFSTCKKENGLDPYVEPSLSTEILIEVDGFESLEGDLFIAINNSSEQFISDTEFYKDTIIDIISDNIVVRIEDVIPGVYAISVFHDENQDAELNLGFLNIPEEGFGFSNNPAIGVSQPSFDDCEFVIEEGQSVVVPISLVYF